MSEKQMEVGVFGLLHPGFDSFAPIRECGLKVAQFQNWNMSLLTPEYARQAKEDAAKNGVRIAAFWAGYTGRIAWNLREGPETCGLVPPDLRAQRVQDLKRGADFAKELGAPAIITHCGFIPLNPRCREYIETVNAIYDVARYCQELGLEFWFETGQETPVTLLRTIQDVGLGNLGINLDTANLILYGNGNPVDSLDVFGPYVKNLHVKDGLFPTDGYGLGREVAVGEGKADFDAIIQKLYALNFTGDLVIEREISGPEQTKDILKAKDLMNSLLEKYKPAK